MELKEYIQPLIRWWWLLITAAVVSSISSYLVVSRQPLIYRSTTTLMIGRAIEDPNPNASQLYLAQQLATTYADIANREPVRDATMEALGLDWLPEYRARPLPNSQLIEIDVTDTNPRRAQAVANEIAAQLILRSPSTTQPEDQERQRFISEQLNLLQVQIANTQNRIEELQSELSTLVSARQIAETQNQLESLGQRLTDLRGNYASMLANTERGATNTIAILEQANLPMRPIGPNSLMTVLVSALVSITLAGAAAYLLEFLDNTIKTNEEAERLFESVRLANIPEIKSSPHPWTFVNEQPRSEFADAYRTLRTNLDFIQVEENLRTILVTSPNVGDGKSTVAINLALIMAHAERKVVLVDADLRKPVIHEALKIPNDRGFSDLFLNLHLLEQIYKPWGRPSITVIPSGLLPPNPTDLLDSRNMSDILDDLRSRFDIVIIDGPPFVIADAVVIAAKVDGVLGVVRPGYSEKDKILGMRKQLKLAGANLLGIVINRTKSSHNHYYRYYHEGQPQKTSTPKRLFGLPINPNIFGKRSDT